MNFAIRRFTDRRRTELETRNAGPPNRSSLNTNVSAGVGRLFQVCSAKNEIFAASVYRQPGNRGATLCVFRKCPDFDRVACRYSDSPLSLRSDGHLGLSTKLLLSTGQGACPSTQGKPFVPKRFSWVSSPQISYSVLGNPNDLFRRGSGVEFFPHREKASRSKLRSHGNTAGTESIHNIQLPSTFATTSSTGHITKTSGARRHVLTADEGPICLEFWSHSHSPR